MSRQFINCNHCGYNGAQLAYIGFDTENKGVQATQHLYGRGQGVCPECGAAFDGCVHPETYDELTAQRSIDD